MIFSKRNEANFLLAFERTITSRICELLQFFHVIWLRRESFRFSYYNFTQERQQFKINISHKYILSMESQHLTGTIKGSEIISSSKAPEPVGLYPHARRVGNLLFLSGVGPRERGTKKIPGVELDSTGTIVSYDIETQCRSVFANVRAILEEAGSSWENLVDVTVFLTNMKDDFATYNRLYAEYFKDNLPCRTTVEINCLPTPIAIELKCIATID